MQTAHFEWLNSKNESSCRLKHVRMLFFLLLFFIVLFCNGQTDASLWQVHRICMLVRWAALHLKGTVVKPLIGGKETNTK